MDEREDPRARLRPLGPEAGCRAPDAEEGLLHCILGEPVVPEHPEREAVRHPADAVVELGQRSLVVARDERHEGLVREMSELPAHGPGVGRVAQRYHGECGFSIGAWFVATRLLRFDFAGLTAASSDRNRMRTEPTFPDRRTSAHSRRWERSTDEEGNRVARTRGRSC